METSLIAPSPHEQQVARASLAHFATLHHARAAAGSQDIMIRLPEQDETVTIPRKALELLEHILTQMAAGKTVALAPTEAELSTQQAADRLGVSWPYLVKLLEQGVIPFKKVGSHRRVQLEDITRYEQQLAAQRQQHLQFLAQQAQELQLGYE